MARSAVTVQSLTAFNTLGAVTSDDFDTANGNSIDVSDVKSSNLLILVTYTDTDDAELTIKAGDFSDAAIGDLTIARPVAAGTQALVIESARFKDEDELILIDGDDTGACSIEAIELP